MLVEVGGARMSKLKGMNKDANSSTEMSNYSDTSELVLDEEGESHRLGAKSGRRWRSVALGVTYTSVIVTTVLGVLASVTATKDRSSAMFAFALDSLLDSFSSVIVLWRYHGNVANLYSIQREKKAVISLAVLFIVSAILTAIKSVVALNSFEKPRGRDSILITIGTINACLCSLLVIFKSLCAYMLESMSIFIDAVSSGIGAITGLAIIISSVVYKENSNIWYLDSALGVVLALIMLAFGVRLLFLECRNI